VRSQAQRDRGWGLVVLEPQLRVLVRLASALARCLHTIVDTEVGRRQGLGAAINRSRLRC
jgi:hypothetical protein